MPPAALIKAFLEQATAQGSRSTVLRPLGWLLSICASAALAAVYLKGPFWLIVLFAIFVGLAATLYLAAFTFCLFKDRDALRSETYSIQKLAIEKGFVGDSVTGIFVTEGAQEEGLARTSSQISSQDDK